VDPHGNTGDDPNCQDPAPEITSPSPDAGVTVDINPEPSTSYLGYSAPGGSTTNQAQSAGRELTYADFKDALNKGTVEERVRAINAVFEDGDYVTASTLFSLTGVPKTATTGENVAYAGARDMLNSISRIRKSGDEFVIDMVEGKDHTSKIQINSLVTLHLEIEDQATFTINESDSFITIEVDNINGGLTSWPLLELPNIKLDNNVLIVLNIPIVLKPKSR
jgi:hypothetical protein